MKTREGAKSAAPDADSGANGLAPGASVTHGELGEGVLLGFEGGGYARVFFRGHGERQVPVSALDRSATWAEQVITSAQPATPDALLRLWLAIEAERLPLMESAAALTSAKVDLLPHQIVLTYKVANASPRRFLVADAVGLGKTIETALILRELASRGELTRAIMVVPAGLVENWRRELNDTFSLDFEVFGSEGDVTDRRSNAFAKHNRLIVSIDTLKRPARVKRLLEAPRWDLIVFDEAHHLTAYESGNKVSKTQNFKLAEAMREHSRDMLLLSATPHQGDHFRFWMLIRLLDARLFENPGDMVDNRHRLNAVVFRRTQADACNSKGEPLFSRRQVHTSAFPLNDAEKKFYGALMDYLRDGYNLAAMQGSKGRSLGFVMTIFQKIASSSFAAVASTLRRRLLMLTIHEALVCDDNLDTDGRDRAYAQARELLRAMHGLFERIKQGIGRCTRGQDDYAVYYFLDPRFYVEMESKPFQSLLSERSRRQVEVGLELTEEGMGAVVPFAQKFLSGDFTEFDNRERAVVPPSIPAPFETGVQCSGLFCWWR